MANAREQPAKGLAGWAESIRLREHEDKALLVLTLIIRALVGLVAVAFILLTENLGGRLYPAGRGAALSGAIDDVWPDRAEENRAQARMELARFAKVTQRRGPRRNTPVRLGRAWFSLSATMCQGAGYETPFGYPHGGHRCHRGGAA